MTSETGTQVDSNVTCEVYTESLDVNEEGEKITDCGDADEEKTTAALRKLLELKEKEIAALQQYLEFKDGVIRKQKEKMQEMEEQQHKRTNLTSEASSDTPNIMKHAANKTGGGAAEKEKEMKRKVAALQKIVYFKDHVIRKQGGVIQEMKEQQNGTNVTCEASSDTPNIMKHAGNKTDGGAAKNEKEEMKRKVAALQKIVYFKDHVIRKQIGLIQELKERQRRNEEDEAPTQTYNDNKLSDGP